MAGIPVVYPDTLPHPQVGQFTPRERRAINREVMRPISRDRAGVRSVAFIFTPDQASEFRGWYEEWLSMGGGFFAAPWPMPWGRGPHVFRFVEPPSWQLVGGALNGQGYWRVTADVELRGRGEMPELEVVAITSRLYPIEVSEHIQVDSSVLKGYWGTIMPPPDDVETNSRVISGILKDAIHRGYFEDACGVNSKVAGGTLELAIKKGYIEDNIAVDSKVASGEFHDKINYDRFVDDGLLAESKIISGTLS